MPAKPNMGMMNMPNMGAMPTAPKPNTGMMPEMMPAKPNTGTMNMPNMGVMHMTPKPNTGMMPEMMPAKPNMGTMNMPNMGAMPTAPKPNTGMMPEMMPAKPNMGTMNMPNTGAMPYMPNPNMGMMPEMAANDMSGCGYKNGELPPCAPLSAGFVPFQQKNPPKYERGEALTRGTLFPGLDLPWKNVVNTSNPYAGTPMGELMALGFVIKELNLYLDTHKNDKEALEMLKSLNKLMKEGLERYVSMYGPQSITDIMSGDEYTWIDNPWPWEYTEKGASENHV
jgi:spore coat protein JB